MARRKKKVRGNGTRVVTRPVGDLLHGILFRSGDSHFSYNIVIGIPITNDSKKRDSLESLFIIASCGCRASIVHPIETLRRLPYLLQHLFPTKRNLLI